MQLSEETQKAIRAVTHDDAQHAAVESIVVAAVERARVVKPLVWMEDKVSAGWKSADPAPDRRYTVFFNGVRWTCRFNTNVFVSFQSEAEADTGCFKHHAAYVLSMLEAV